MPFRADYQGPWTVESINKVPATATGVYGIYASGWIYVGKGGIRDRLLAHYYGDNSCITNNRPTGWVAEVTANADQREKELIAEFNPVCNQRIG